LGLDEIGLIFPIAALIVLCFMSAVRKVLITHQCFGCFGEVSAQHQGSPSNISTPPPNSRLGVGRILGGEVVRRADLTLTKGIFHTI